VERKGRGVVGNQFENKARVLIDRLYQRSVNEFIESATCVVEVIAAPFSIFREFNKFFEKNLLGLAWRALAE
jgi:hypothetical protein